MIGSNHYHNSNLLTTEINGFFPGFHLTNKTFFVFLWSSYKSTSESGTRSTIGTRTACFLSRSAKLHSRFQTDSSWKISARHNKVLPNSTPTIAPCYLRSTKSVSPSGFPQREPRNTKHVVIVKFPEVKALHCRSFIKHFGVHYGCRCSPVICIFNQVPGPYQENIDLMLDNADRVLRGLQKYQGPIFTWNSPQWACLISMRVISRMKNPSIKD